MEFETKTLYVEQTQLEIARGIAGDETGLIKFEVRGEQARKIKKDAVVAFRNCFMALIKGKYV